MHKKAQSLSITTIIIAILAILVLVVLFFVFTGRMGIFGQGLSDCPGTRGTASECQAAGKAALPGTECEKTNPDKPYCCVELKS